MTDEEYWEEYIYRSWFGAVPESRTVRIVEIEHTERPTKIRPKRIIPIVLATLACGEIVEFNGKDWKRARTTKTDCPRFMRLTDTTQPLSAEDINAACNYCRHWPMSEGWNL